MTSEQLEQVWGFEDSLKVGDTAVIRWTSSRRILQGGCRVLAISDKSITVELTEKVVSVWETRDAGSVLRAPRLHFGSKLWSCNNRVQPTNGYL